ncbi:MAG: divergent PAP2 family protein [Turicibacter sp.]|nr:divergent PAP2 family protein [Turicibacter sp.]
MYANQFVALLNNHHIWIAVFSAVSAQCVKMLIEYAFTKKIDKTALFGTGGMPSSHSAFVTAMATSIGMTEGLNSSMFALAFAFAMIVMYDAAGVRRAAGKHAKIINLMLDTLKDFGINTDTKLRELLGHSPIEVIVGALWGVLISTLAFLVFDIN